MSSSDNFFDTDKLRGFINSANNDASLYFWIVIFIYLSMVSIIYISICDIDLEKLNRVSFISGTGMVFLGYWELLIPH